MELAADEPWMDRSGKFDHFAKTGAWRPTGHLQTLLFELSQQRVVNFVTMTVALGYFGHTVDFAGQRAFGQLADLGTETHGAAEVGILAALLDLAGGIQPFSNQPNHRVRRVRNELG